MVWLNAFSPQLGQNAFTQFQMATSTSVINIRVRSCKIGVIEKIEEISAKLKADPLRKMELATH